MTDILAKVTFGSKLYGTSVPTSDDDFRAVYLPTIQSLALQRAKDAWEDKSEEDTSVFSLQHFCRLVSEGQSIAIELLSADGAAIRVTSPIWETLRANRKRFYTKNMHSFLGYAKTMAGKYSARIDRLNETEAVMAAMRGYMGEGSRLGDMWDHLPESLNAQKGLNERSSGPDHRVYRVCGRELQATVTIVHALTVVSTITHPTGSAFARRAMARSNGRRWLTRSALPFSAARSWRLETCVSPSKTRNGYATFDWASSTFWSVGWTRNWMI
jgi:hypothetical protein